MNIFLDLLISNIIIMLLDLLIYHYKLNMVTSKYTLLIVLDQYWIFMISNYQYYIYPPIILD